VLRRAPTTQSHKGTWDATILLRFAWKQRQENAQENEQGNDEEKGPGLR
jgi:hypothetical protein